MKRAHTWKAHCSCKAAKHLFVIRSRGCEDEGSDRASRGGKGQSKHNPLSSKVWVGGEHKAYDFGYSSQVRKTQKESSMATRTVVPDKTGNHI